MKKLLRLSTRALTGCPANPYTIRGGITRTGLTLPVITEADLVALASLSMEELQARRQSRLEAMGAEKIAQIEERKAENIAKMYDLMGGHEGLDRLKAFMTEYLKGAKGWARISELLPQGLTDRQAKGYLAMAVYVDNIARPMYSYLTKAYTGSKKNNIITRGGMGNPIFSRSLCEEYLANSLSGTGMSVAAFKALMDDTSETAGPPMDETWEEIDYEGIWAEYTFCIDHSY